MGKLKENTQKDPITKRLSLHDEVLKERENVRLSPPNILQVIGIYAKALEDFFPFHHSPAPPISTDFYNKY